MSDIEDRRKFLSRLGYLMLASPLAACGTTRRRTARPGAVAEPKVEEAAVDAAAPVAASPADAADEAASETDPGVDSRTAERVDEGDEYHPSGALLPSPELADDDVLGFVAGIRPYRRGTIRIEPERAGETTFVHNYGHGGSGITLAFGSALEVLDIVASLARPSGPVVVLGAGVCGLTSALILAEAGYGVIVQAAEFSPDTTSDIAGGQFAPSLVATGRSAAERRRFERMLRTSYQQLMRRAGSEFGIHERPNYIAGGGGGGLRRLPADLVGPGRSYTRLPFAADIGAGSMIPTLLIEPPVLLPRLMHECRRNGVSFETRRHGSRDEVLALRAGIVINCLGLGAEAITGDRDLQPIRGHLVHIRPQALPYLLSHRNGYVFPRRDALVLGGSFERGVRDPRPVSSICRRILGSNRRLFAP